MKYDRLESIMSRHREALQAASACRKELRALGIDGFPGPVDLPGDAPNSSTSSNGSPPAGNLPPEPTEEDPDGAETAYWRFDGRRKGYAEWKNAPQSERDAFKCEYRAGRTRSAEASGDLIPRRDVLAALDANYSAIPDELDAGEVYAAIRAMPAVAPRAEIPMVTLGDVAAYREARDAACRDPHSPDNEQLAALRAVRARWQERMGQS